MRPHGAPAHQGDLCHLAHTCPPCEDGTGACADLFMSLTCGLVACETEEEA